MGRYLKGSAVVALLALVVAGGVALWLWNDRPSPDEIGPLAPSLEPGTPSDGSVLVTWLGVTTLLFDDGETRILTDGFFSRPTATDLVTDRPVSPDLAGIDAALSAAGITELAAVIPVHSHFDHAMDTGEVAKRTGAVVVGSSSTANAARGAGLAEERIVDLTDGGRLAFGQFEVTLIRSRHAPVGNNRDIPFPGTIDAPLVPPAPVSAWKEGASYSILLAHPRGTALVQGSAGYVEGALDGQSAEVVFLGIGGLGRIGPDSRLGYWRETVVATGAGRVFAIHWDDFTRPYGDIRAFPRALDDPGWGLGLIAEAHPAPRPEVLPFGRPVRLY